MTVEARIPPLKATLHHLAFASENPEALAEFYSRALGYRLSREGTAIVAQARDRQLVFVQGRSKTLAYAAYATPTSEDLENLKLRLKLQDWPFQIEAIPGLETGAIALHDPDGTRFVFGVASRPTPSVSADLAATRPARLQHVVMASRNAARIASFCQTHLGFILSDNVVDGEGHIRTSFLRCSEEHHSFAVFQAPEDRLDHHCYEAGDWGLIRDWSDHMASHRIPLKWGPGRHGPGNNLFMFIHDIDGNWVEISAELETVAPDRPVGEWPHEEFTLNLWGQGLLRS